ncbi:MAG: hypothetical protein DIZ80_00905 [endosymbiont of Galathealinum brachiosum]|uniref:Uncharacterized protein n=1 Tax=endosymbiont of Galathealinum brachiosum TaxID=2200906 RepID=A0A370DNB9_9GAMM|nr:MAG: hypothetical protein DIZ80_00905 [endosymbiont of Galathealinum brachiosum]
MKRILNQLIDSIVYEVKRYLRRGEIAAYWKTSDFNYIALVATDKFSCWGEIEIKGYGKFDRSSSFLRFDDNGCLIEILDGPVSTSVEEDFHITSIYFVSNLQLLHASFVNYDMTTGESRCRVEIDSLKECSEREVPLKLIDEVVLFNENPEKYKINNRIIVN